MELLQTRLRLALASALSLLAAIFIFRPGFENTERPCIPQAPFSTPSELQLLASSSLPGACSFGGMSIPHGGHINLYQEASVSPPDKCVYETRYCRFGVLSDGFFAYHSCRVKPN